MSSSSSSSSSSKKRSHIDAVTDVKLMGANQQAFKKMSIHVVINMGAFTGGNYIFQRTQELLDKFGYNENKIPAPVEVFNVPLTWWQLTLESYTITTVKIKLNFCVYRSYINDPFPTFSKGLAEITKVFVSPLESLFGPITDDPSIIDDKQKTFSGDEWSLTVSNISNKTIERIDLKFINEKMTQIKKLIEQLDTADNPRMDPTDMFVVCKFKTKQQTPTSTIMITACDTWTKLLNNKPIDMCAHLIHMDVNGKQIFALNDRKVLHYLKPIKFMRTSDDEFEILLHVNTTLLSPRLNPDERALNSYENGIKNISLIYLSDSDASSVLNNNNNFDITQIVTGEFQGNETRSHFKNAARSPYEFQLAIQSKRSFIVSFIPPDNETINYIQTNYPLKKFKLITVPLINDKDIPLVSDNFQVTSIDLQWATENKITIANKDIYDKVLIVAIKYPGADLSLSVDARAFAFRVIITRKEAPIIEQDNKWIRKKIKKWMKLNGSDIEINIDEDANKKDLVIPMDFLFNMPMENNLPPVIYNNNSIKLTIRHSSPWEVYFGAAQIFAHYCKYGHYRSGIYLLTDDRDFINAWISDCDSQVNLVKEINENSHDKNAPKTISMYYEFNIIISWLSMGKKNRFEWTSFIHDFFIVGNHGDNNVSITVIKEPDQLIASWDELNSHVNNRKYPSQDKARIFIEAIKDKDIDIKFIWNDFYHRGIRTLNDKEQQLKQQIKDEHKKQLNIKDDAKTLEFKLIHKYNNGDLESSITQAIEEKKEEIIKSNRRIEQLVNEITEIQKNKDNTKGKQIETEVIGYSGVSGGDATKHTYYKIFYYLQQHLNN